MLSSPPATSEPPNANSFRDNDDEDDDNSDDEALEEEFMELVRRKRREGGKKEGRRRRLPPNKEKKLNLFPFFLFPRWKNVDHRLRARSDAARQRVRRASLRGAKEGGLTGIGKLCLLQEKLRLGRGRRGPFCARGRHCIFGCGSRFGRRGRDGGRFCGAFCRRRGRRERRRGG